MKYGWHPSLPTRAPKFHFPRLGAAVLPTHVDLRPHCPPVYNQGDLGSCTANAAAGVLEFNREKQGLKLYVPSRLFIYYNERVIEGTVGVDSGATCHDSIVVVSTKGACDETLWPYVEKNFREQPPAGDYTDALSDCALQFAQLDNTNLTDLRAVLADGFPFLGGFTVYESFESEAVAKSGVVPMPGFFEQALGGHAVMTVGYDDASQRFIVRNSWGPGWGQAGYFTVPYEYWTNPQLASDFWDVRLVGQGK